MAMWWAQDVETIFMGVVQIPAGELKKLHAPTDLYGPGHIMEGDVFLYVVLYFLYYYIISIDVKFNDAKSRLLLFTSLFEVQFLVEPSFWKVSDCAYCIIVHSISLLF